MDNEKTARTGNLSGLFFYKVSNRKRPTLSIASPAFFMGNIWNTCHRSVQTSSRQGTAAWMSLSRRRMESESRISLVPAWIRVGGKPEKSPNRGERRGSERSCPLA